jgi:hypothetical protein
MQPKNASEKINAALAGLSIDDRICHLVCSIMMSKAHAVHAVRSVLSVIEALTRNMSAEQRMQMAEACRDCGDRIERRRESITA